MSALTFMSVILVMLAWAACFPLITIGIDSAPHLTFAALRAAIAGLFLTGVAIALRHRMPRGWRLWIKLTGVGLGATSLGFLGMFHAAAFLSPGIATVIASSQPLFAALLASSFLGERLTGRGKVGMLLGFAGIVTISSPEFGSDGQVGSLLGMSYILLAVSGVTASNVLIKSIVQDVDVLVAMGLQMLIGAFPLMMSAWIAEDPTGIQWSALFVADLLVLALPGTALAYWLWFLVLRRTSLNRANAFSFLVPILGLVMGSMFFDETINRVQAIGIVFTVLGVALVAYRETNPSNART